jgi:Arc/MetJ family transcription regulator
MRTNIVLDDAKMTKTMKIANVTTKREAVDRALSFYVRAHEQADLRALAGKVDFYDDYDYRAMRKNPHVSD